MDRALVATQRRPMEWATSHQSHETRAGRLQTLRRDRLKSGLDQVVIGKFQNAMYSVPTVYKLDSAPEFIGYQVTDHIGAVATARLWNDRGTAALLPIDAQVVLTVFILLLLPTNQHATVFIR